MFYAYFLVVFHTMHLCRQQHAFQGCYLLWSPTLSTTAFIQLFNLGLPGLPCHGRGEWEGAPLHK